MRWCVLPFESLGVAEQRGRRRRPQPRMQPLRRRQLEAHEGAPHAAQPEKLATQLHVGCWPLMACGWLLMAWLLRACRWRLWRLTVWLLRAWRLKVWPLAWQLRLLTLVELQIHAHSIVCCQSFWMRTRGLIEASNDG